MGMRPVYLSKVGTPPACLSDCRTLIDVIPILEFRFYSPTTVSSEKVTQG